MIFSRRRVGLWLPSMQRRLKISGNKSLRQRHDASGTFLDAAIRLLIQFIALHALKALALDPDLVLIFSDFLAEIPAELICAGVTVMAYNQRDVEGILAMIRHLGATVGKSYCAERLAADYEQRLAQVAAMAEVRARLLVYFEERDDPMITGIGLM